MVSIIKHKEEYLAGLAGVNSCPCFISVKDGILSLNFQEIQSKTTTIQFLAKDIELQFDNRNTINTAAVGEGALVGGLAFGGVGALLGGMAGSETKTHGLIMKFAYSGYDSVIYFKPSLTIANLFNQLLLFKQENILTDIDSYNKKKNDKIKDEQKRRAKIMKWVLGLFALVYLLTPTIEETKVNEPEKLYSNSSSTFQAPFKNGEKSENKSMKATEKAFEESDKSYDRGQRVKSSTSSTEPLITDEEIERQFSPWDGSHMKFCKYVKDEMNDPDSFEHISTTYIKKDALLAVNMVYRGKNGFGALMKTAAVGIIDPKSGEVVSVAYKE